MTARHSRLGLSVALALAVLAWATTPASALTTTTYGLNYRITDPGNPQVGNQLFVDVIELANPNQVNFKFYNTGPAASSITDIYFDDGNLLGIASITNGSGTSFSQGASPPAPPGGTSVDFNVSAGFLADSNPPVQPNGVNPGEFVTITFNLLPSAGGYAGVISALALAQTNPTVDITGGLRIAVHVQGLSNGGSDSYINGPSTTSGGPVVPEPSSMAIAGLGALGFIGYGLRRRRSK